MYGARLACGADCSIETFARGPSTAWGRTFVGVTIPPRPTMPPVGNRAGNELHDVFEASPGVRDEVAGTGDDLAQVVRRHVGRHAATIADAGGAVDEQGSGTRAAYGGCKNWLS